MKLALASMALVLSLPVTTRAAQSKTDVTDRMQSAATVLHDVTQAPDKGIPEEVFKGAKCVAVVPSLIKGGFGFGGEHGRGVTTCRLPNGQWSAPAFFVITGGSWGAQIGLQDIQLVMMIMNDQGMQHMLQNKFQIGTEASAAAGPVGRHASAGTDWKLQTEMLTYSRSKGLFAGIDLGGSKIEPDKDSTLALYGKDESSAQLLTGKVQPPPAANVFLAAVKDSESKIETSRS